MTELLKSVPYIIATQVNEHDQSRTIYLPVSAKLNQLFELLNGKLRVEVCREQVILLMTWNTKDGEEQESQRIVQNHPGMPLQACSEMIRQTWSQYVKPTRQTKRTKMEKVPSRK